MTRFILAAVVVLLVWGLSLGLDLPLLVPIGVTGLVVLVLVGLHLLDRLREARRARALEAALAAQPVEAVRPDQVEELVRVRAEMAATVKTLGRRRLYRLPWFAIIGPPGAGKSTALRESGLTFPGVEASTGPLRGMGGTRNCDWWITNEGVILDTAGRWTSENEDRDEWLGFLDLLAAQRPKRPIDGLLVALPVDALVADEAAIEALAARLRDRVDEVQGRLKLGLPVYLLVTKCDLVAGFVETFGDLSKEDRGQMWGFTEPLAARGPARDRLQARFDELLAALDHRAGKRMGDERSVEARARIFAFPEEMASVREPLAQLVARLFAENIYAETPRLRGVYFTSGTQEGRSIDRVMHALADAMGMPHAAPAAAAPTPKSYFLRDLFTKVVFADVGLARWSEGEVRRQGRQQLVAAAAVLTLALGVAGLPLVAWRANASYLDETAAVVDEAGHVSDGDGPADPAQLASLGARARELRRFEEEGPPLSMRMGLYPEEVHPAFERLYLDTLRRAVVAPILDADAD
ncbi:MAG: type VI secretion system membrane subunit TssM, partial [Sandaracinaceae bacterium]